MRFEILRPNGKRLYVHADDEETARSAAMRLVGPGGLDSISESPAPPKTPLRELPAVERESNNAKYWKPKELFEDYDREKQARDIRNRRRMGVK